MFNLTGDQKKASSTALKWVNNTTEKYLVIQGSAGTGKSALIQHLMSSIAGANNHYKRSDIDLLATTNKATSVVAKLSSKPVKTLYSYLKLIPKENYNTGELSFVKGKNYKQIKNRLLIVDEGSYIDDESFKLLDEATVNCKIILVGDWFQLVMPSKEQEESGNTTPIMQRLECTQAILDEVVRHNGFIAKLGAQCKEMVRTGVFTGITANGTDVVHFTREAGYDKMDEIFHRKKYIAESANVLAWRNESVIKFNRHIRFKRGMLGQVSLNETLVTNKPIVNKRGQVASSDTAVKITKIVSKVTKIGIAGVNICINKSPEVYFMPYNQVATKKLLNELKNSGFMKDFWAIKNTWLDLRPAYAGTVHKSQGSTYETVIIDLDDLGSCDDADAVARMLYVAITRASKKVILLGNLPEQYGGVVKTIV